MDGKPEDQLDQVVTRRRQSLLESDFARSKAAVVDAVRGRRILVVGGGGSIGSATTQLLVHFDPSAIHIVDQNENYLAELVRNLRGRAAGLPSFDLRTFPIDYGGPVMERLLKDSSPYDIVLHFAALKHVRSEKDMYSLLQMLDTNVVRHIRFKRSLAANGHGRTYFAVSTDKAANPTSLMGASKRLMEDIVFGVAADRFHSTTSARFANVAFSNGSLLQAFLRRLELRQPLAVPRETRRYFISLREAAELCVLATFMIPNGHVAFPKLEPEEELQELDAIATRVLQSFGLSPVFFDEEAAARASVESLARSGKWPVLLTPLDTSGEKPFEEFVGDDEVQVDIGLERLKAVKHRSSSAFANGLFDWLDSIVNCPTKAVSKADIAASVGHALANFHHVDTGRDLDQRL